MANVFHKDFVLDNNHAFTVRTYADIPERDADTTFHQASTNVDKIVRVNDADGSNVIGYFILATTAPFWEPIGTLFFDTFLELKDTPFNYTNDAGRVAQVNVAEDGLEFGQQLRTTDKPNFLKLGVGGAADGLTPLHILAENTLGRAIDLRAPIALLTSPTIRFFESAFGSDAISLMAPVTLASSYSITLPSPPANGANQILVNQIVAGVVTSAYTPNPTIGGNLTVDGANTTINSTTVLIRDKNITIGNVVTPTDVTADGGGLTLKGTTDKTINWINSTNRWAFNQGIDIASGQNFSVDGNTLIVDSVNDRVGIGVSVPLAKLHLDTTTSVDAEILLMTSGSGDPVITFDIAAASQWKVGADGADNDHFKITNGMPAVFGINDFLIIEPSTGRVQLFNNNLEIGNVGTPTDATADGGGITLRGTTNKTITWDIDSTTWDFNQGLIVDPVNALGVALVPFGLIAGETSELRFIELASGGEEYVGFKAPNFIDTNIIWTLPDVDGTINMILSTNGAGILAWTSVGIGTMVGPGASVDNEVLIFSGTTGTLVKQSGIIFDQLKAVFVPGGGGFNGPLSPSSMSLTSVTTNEMGTLSRFNSGNGYARNKNMGFQDPGASVAGTFTADGRFKFDTKVIAGKNNLFFSNDSINREVGRVFECVIDTSLFPTPNPAIPDDTIMVGFSNNTFTGDSYNAFFHGLRVSAVSETTFMRVEIFENGVLQPDLFDVTFVIKQSLRLRIVLLASGADYFVSRGGSAFVFIGGTSSITTSPLHVGVSIEGGLFMVSEIQTYDPLIEQNLLLQSLFGDTFTEYERVGSTVWRTGLDDSDGDSFKINDGVFGTDSQIKITTGDTLTLGKNSLTSEVIFLAGLRVKTGQTAVDAGFPGNILIFGVTDTTVTRIITIASVDILKEGKEFIIKDESGLASNPAGIEIATQGSELIDGSASSVFITATFGVVRLYARGGNLFSW